MRWIPVSLRGAAVFAATLAAGTLGAQSPIFSQNTLIGWTAAGTTPTVPGTVDVQNFQTCVISKIDCKPVLTNNLIRYAGGTAYDSSKQVVWSSDGNLIDGRTVVGCKQICLMKATKVLNPLKRPMVSGLAIADRKKRLFQLETYPGAMAVVTYAPAGNCWKPFAKCAVTLGGNWIAGGIAYDEPRDLLYISISQKVLTTWQNVILVAKASSPCTFFCKFQVKNCWNDMIHGLAYDCCGSSAAIPGGSLYLALGAFTQRVFVVDPFKCLFKIDPKCCRKGNNPWRGLAIVPGWRKAKVGKPCSGKPCPFCPNITAGLAGGDPSLGNTNFKITLTGAPAVKPAVLVLGGGVCTNGIPVFCGFLYPSLVPMPLILGTTTTGTGCFGSALMPLPIPANVKLCNRPFCAQWLVFCFGGGTFGASLSNAVQFTIASS